MENEDFNDPHLDRSRNKTDGYYCISNESIKTCLECVPETSPFYLLYNERTRYSKEKEGGIGSIRRIRKVEGASKRSTTARMIR